MRRPGAWDTLQRELLQVRLGHRRRRALEERARRGRLGEGDHVAQRGRAGEQHRDAVESERDAAVRRCARAQRLEQEAEPQLRRGVVDAEQREDARLQRGIADADAAAAELEPVVARTSYASARARSGARLEQRDVVGVRRGERMMHRRRALRSPDPARTSGSRCTTTNAWTSSGTSSRRCAHGLSHAVERRRGARGPAPATNRPSSPSARPSASARRRRRGTSPPCPSSPSAVRLSTSRPLAPAPFASASSSSICLRDSAAPPGTRMPRTRSPRAMAACTNGELARAEHRCHVAQSRVRSAGRAGRSRSAPSRRRTSCAGTATRPRTPAACQSVGDQPLGHATGCPPAPTNDASMSICVNSGWRSARRSSSRKQRAIWK